MKNRTLACWSLTVILVLLTGGLASAKDIKVLSQFPMSGPVGSLPEFGMGYIDATKYINEELKGYEETVLHADERRQAAEAAAAGLQRQVAVVLLEQPVDAVEVCEVGVGAERPRGVERRVGEQRLRTGAAAAADVQLARDHGGDLVR